MKFMTWNSIMIAGKPAAAGSAMLRGFISPINAAVYDRCIGAGMEFCGMVAPFEFGLDDLFRDDGSSADLCGAIASVDANDCDFALCSDVFGKIPREAARNGLICIRPAYGSVSRYGLIPSAPSMDQIGILCRDFSVGAEILRIITGHDTRDGASIPDDGLNQSEEIGQIFVPDAFADKIPDNLADKAKIKTGKLDYFEQIASVLYILASAEFSACVSRFDGIKFGHRSGEAAGINEIYVKSRSEGFGFDAKLAALTGCMVLSGEKYGKLYHKSMQIRGLFKQNCDKLLGEYGAIAIPADSGGEGFARLALYAAAPLGGYASVSFNAGRTAMQLIAPHGREEALITLAEEVCGK